MLNISGNNEMLYHFSKKFRNSECMEFLTPILDKYSKQLSTRTESRRRRNKQIVRYRVA